MFKYNLWPQVWPYSDPLIHLGYTSKYRPSDIPQQHLWVLTPTLKFFEKQEHPSPYSWPAFRHALIKPPHKTWV